MSIQNWSKRIKIWTIFYKRGL